MTMDSLFQRVEDADSGMDHDEMIYEAAAVLAGTILTLGVVPVLYRILFSERAGPQQASGTAPA